MQIRKDTFFNSKVVDAAWCNTTNKWTVRSEKGLVAKAQYLIIATGFAAKRHFPEWKGLDKFKGIMHHPSFWPAEGVDVKGKKVGVVGTGATGVQLRYVLYTNVVEVISNVQFKPGTRKNGRRRRKLDCIPEDTKSCSTNETAQAHQRGTR